MAQTFSVDTRRSAGIKTEFSDTVQVIRVDPVETPTATGKRVTMGFPVLYVAGWVAEGDKFAAEVAEVLTAHFARKAGA